MEIQFYVFVVKRNLNGNGNQFYEVLGHTHVLSTVWTVLPLAYPGRQVTVTLKTTNLIYIWPERYLSKDTFDTSPGMLEMDKKQEWEQISLGLLFFQHLGSSVRGRTGGTGAAARASLQVDQAPPSWDKRSALWDTWPIDNLPGTCHVTLHTTQLSVNGSS